VHKLAYSPEAAKDLSLIEVYISSTLDNPVGATNTIKGILRRIEMLREHPLMGPVLTSIIQSAPKDYRFLTCGNYIVFYRLGESAVRIIRVLYAKRDYMTELFADN
jgi:addiction module RelE/StbE family toxin